jgi:hypothetical protein
MRAFAIVAILMSVSVLAVFAIASTIAIYGFDGYEPAWGKGGSVQVAWWMSLAAAIIVLFGSGVGALLAGKDNVTKPWVVAVTGVAFAFLSIVVFWLLSASGFEYAHLYVIPWFLLVPAYVGYLLVWPSSGGAAAA